MGYGALVIDIIKTGFVLAVVIGVICLIIWAVVRNMKLLFGLGVDKQLVYWFIAGLKEGYDDKDLKVILLEKNYKPKVIIKALEEAYKIMIREAEGKNANKGRKLRNPEEEIKERAGKE